MRPANEADLVEVVRSARGPLVVRGGGTRPVGRPLVGEMLETGALTGVRLYEPGALTLVAGAGTPLSEVEAVLAEGGQRLAFEPMDHRGLMGAAGEPTLGGVVAGNVSGPRRAQAGACRDFLMGVRFVDGTGALVKNGGRVMKNVTGYDLVKLMAGSWGTLGVMSEVSLKVLPAPEAGMSLVWQGLGETEAVALMAAALGSPFEVSGAARWPDGRVGLRIEGFADSVAYRAGELARLLVRFGLPLRLEADESRAFWVGVRDVAPFHGRAGDVWRVVVKPSESPVVAALGESLIDWGGGLVWVLVPEGVDLRARMGAVPGHATLVRASVTTRARIAPFPPEPAPVAALARAIRTRFDPRGILNAGIMD